ncbi:MAG: PotD/PotF family extracellular solute-binding protein, partial [Verrucomicrobiales bacterium]
SDPRDSGRPALSSALVALLALAAAFLPACGKKETLVPESTASFSAAGKPLRLFSWSEYFDPEILEKFTAETGIEVEYLTYGDGDELEAKLKSRPGYHDIVVGDDISLEVLNELQLIRDLDKSLLPNLANIDEDYLDLPFDPGNAFSAPYMWGTSLVAYRSDEIEDPEPSWALLWNESLKGKVAVMEDRQETLSIALLALGYSLNSEDPAELEPAGLKTVELIRKVDARLGDDAAVRKGLDSGAILAGMCYSGDAAMVAAENENVAFFIPREGAPLWIDSLAITKDSSNAEAAHLFVNFMLDAENAAANSNYTWYASPNKAAEPCISEDLLGDETIYPSAQVLERCEFLAFPSLEREQLMNRAWLRVRKAIQQQNISRKAPLEPGAPAATAQLTGE